MKNPWEKNSKGILPKLSNTNSITPTIRPAKWAKSHSFLPITSNSSLSPSPCPNHQLSVSRWKKSIGKFNKKTRSRNKSNMWWALLYKIMRSTWLKSHKNSNRPERQPWTWLDNFSTNSNSRANGSSSCLALVKLAMHLNRATSIWSFVLTIKKRIRWSKCKRT